MLVLAPVLNADSGQYLPFLNISDPGETKEREGKADKTIGSDGKDPLCAVVRTAMLDS